MGKRKKNKLSKAQRARLEAERKERLRQAKIKAAKERAEELEYASVVLDDAAVVMDLHAGLHKGYGFVGPNDTVDPLFAMRTAAGLAKPDGWFDQSKCGGVEEDDYTVAAQELGAFLKLVMPDTYGEEFKSIPTWGNLPVLTAEEVSMTFRQCADHMRGQAHNLTEAAASL